MFARFVQASLYGRDRDTQQATDLSYAQLLVVEQQGCAPVLGGETVDGLHNQPPKVPFLHNRFGRWCYFPNEQFIHPQATHHLFQRKRSHPLPPDVASADVQRDTIEPALEPVVIPQLIQRKISLQYGLLHQLLGQVFAAHHAQRDALDHLLIPLDELSERVLVTGPGRGDQVSISLFNHSSLLANTRFIYIVGKQSGKVTFTAHHPAHSTDQHLWTPDPLSRITSTKDRLTASLGINI
jgi:hypothetical protein